MRHTRWAMAAIVAVLVSITHAEEPKKLKYPDTKKGDVVDDYHGTKVADPYRWLEDDVRKSKDVADWVEAAEQGHVRLPRSHPRARGDQEAHHRPVELREVLRPVQGTAAATSSSRTTALQNQTVLYVQDTLDGEPRDAARPEHVDQGRHRRAAGLAVSDDGKLLAYGVAEAGSDWNTWKVLDVDDAARCSPTS